MVLKFRNIDYSNWSKTWSRSVQPRKQRKFIINAPLHIRRKLISSMLSKYIKNLVGINSLPVRVGDYVRILRGKYRNVEGFVIFVDTKRYRIFVDNAKEKNKKGKEVYYPIHPSKLLILKLNLQDKYRLEIIKRKMISKNIPEDRINELINNYSVSKEDVEKAIENNKKLK